MSIYSANRSGSVALSSVKANESYKSNDLGRILYESQVNDMTVFESILASDFREIKGLQEGTLLRSEISALNEASAKEIFAKLKDRLKAFWAKIKGAIKDVMRKISAYILRNGKAFAAIYRDFQKKNMAAKFSVTLDIPKKEFEPKLPTNNEIERLIAYNQNNDTIDKSAIIAEALAKSVGKSEPMAPSDFRTYVRENFHEEQTVTNTSSLIADMVKWVESPSESISELKKAESAAEKYIKALETELKNAEKSADKDNDKVSASKGNTINNITALVSVSETIITNITSAKIDLVRARVKLSRAALGKIMNEVRGMAEAAFAAEDEVDSVLNDVSDDMDSDTKDAVDEIIAAELAKL